MTVSEGWTIVIAVWICSAMTLFAFGLLMRRSRRKRRPPAPVEITGGWEKRLGKIEKTLRMAAAQTAENAKQLDSHAKGTARGSQAVPAGDEAAA
jgi:hypothetical protein